MLLLNLFSVRGLKVLASKMPRILNVAEKNDAAKNLAEIMSKGRYRKREGFSKYNKIYEYDFHLLGRNVTMTMTSVSGHLLNFEFVGTFRNWRGCKPLSLFEAPVAKTCQEDFQPIKKTLENEIRTCDTLVIWTDCDREGENIGMEIVQVCKNVKPNIRVYRAKFSEITGTSVARACSNLMAPDENTSTAVDVRQELDLRIGAAFTRFQTLRLQKVFPEALADSLISYGSCQFPTLGFVVERYKLVQNFIPENFWKISVTHVIENTEANFSWKRGRLFDQTACQVLFSLCEESPLSTVVNVSSKPKSKWRPLPLDTVEMEKAVSRKLSINAKQAMKIAEKLYTQGYISYPRTETNIFPKEFNLTNLVQLQTTSPDWGEFAQSVIERGPNPRVGKKSDHAHPPIHPTKAGGGLQGDERRLYEFIVRHFLAGCSDDAKGHETTVEIDIAQERFVANGLVILERNYLDVYPYDKWVDKPIPEYRVGQSFQPTILEVVDGETSAPPLLTEADLIALMDKHGIGTDATHAEHIETIKQRMYVGVVSDKRFVPGELGMGLVEGYDAMGFAMSKPHLRAQLEADLKCICEGTKNAEAVLADQIKRYRDVFVEAMNQAQKLDTSLATYFGQATKVVQTDIEPEAPKVVSKCPNCNLDLVLKPKRDNAGYYVSCIGFPACKKAAWLPEYVQNVQLTETDCEKCLPTSVKKLKFTFRRGSVFPLFPTEYEGCLGGCEPDLLETLGVASISSRNSAGTNENVAQPRQHANASQPNNNPAVRNDTNRATQRQPNNNLAVRNDMNRSAQRQPLGLLDQGSNQPDTLTCNCGEGALLLTVRKEGPNQGRQFYKCAKTQGQCCTFFQWADEVKDMTAANNDRNKTAKHNNRITTATNSITQRGSVLPRDGASCSCGLPAKRATVQKAGPNQGRSYLTCSKPWDQKCSFFEWEDDNPAPRNNSIPNQSKYTKRGNSTTTTAQVKKKRKCGNCGQEGHIRTRCPNR